MTVALFVPHTNSTVYNSFFGVSIFFTKIVTCIFKNLRLLIVNKNEVYQEQCRVNLAGKCKLAEQIDLMFHLATSLFTCEL